MKSITFVFLSALLILLTLSSCGNNTVDSDTSGTGSNESDSEQASENIGMEFTVFQNDPSNDMIEFEHETGKKDYLYFIHSTDSTGLDVQIEFPDDPDTPENYRLSQIVMPDGSSDGPFGTVVNNYPLTQSGGYQLIFAESNMVGEPFTGKVIIKLSQQ